MKEKKCGNCTLYDKNLGECKVIIPINGEIYHLPVFPNDKCHFIELGIAAEQIKIWCENPSTGKLSNKGIVKIEYSDKSFNR